MAKKHPAVLQAFLDLDKARTKFLMLALTGEPIPHDAATELETMIGNASQLLQRTLNRITRIAEQGASDEAA